MIIEKMVVRKVTMIWF